LGIVIDSILDELPRTLYGARRVHRRSFIKITAAGRVAITVHDREWRHARRDERRAERPERQWRAARPTAAL
jgi:hypothetical protein